MLYLCFTGPGKLLPIPQQPSFHAPASVKLSPKSASQQCLQFPSFVILQDSLAVCVCGGLNWSLFNYFVCAHECGTQVHVRIHVCACDMHSCMQTTEVGIRCLQWLSTLFFEAGSLAEPGSH